MALRVKNHVFFNTGYTAASSSGILAGMVVALTSNATTGEVEITKAIRGTHGYEVIAGLAGDDATNSGNTIAIVDPVSQEFMSKPARRLGDYLDETITNRTNWTDAGTAKRGVTVYSIGGEFATDQYVSTASASGAAADAGAAPTYAVGNVWLYGVTANAGKLIDDGGQAITTNVPGVAVLTGAPSNSLLPFNWQIMTVAL